MAEGGVVDAVEDPGGHGGDPADGDVPLAVAHRAAGDEGVGEDDGAGTRRARGEVGADPVHGGGQHGFVARLVHAELVLHEGRFEVGQAVEGDVAVAVGEHHGRTAGGGVGPQVDARPVNEPGTDAEASRGVVVAGDHDRGHAEVGQPVQGVVEELDGGERRDGTVVHVSRDDHGVRLAFAGGVDEMADEPGLGVEHVHPVERPAQMPVGSVQEPHDPRRVTAGSDITGGYSRISPS